MILKQQGVFLKCILPKDIIDKIPLEMRNSTSTKASFMLLGNEDEISLLEDLTGENIRGKFCFDYILVYEE